MPFFDVLGLGGFRGTAGDDTVRSDGQNTRFVVLDGADSVQAGGGDDYLSGGLGDDWLAGNSGWDTLRGGQGDDTLTGGAGDDAMNGDDGSDSLSGGAGNDTLISDAGANTLNGGSGDDFYAIKVPTIIVESANPAGGFDLVRSTISFTLPDGVEGLSLRSWPDPGVRVATGNEGDNIIEVLYATDTAIGLGGNDTLTGSTESHLIGGDGDDHYIVRGRQVTVTEERDGGYDTLSADRSFVLPRNVEEMTLRFGENAIGRGAGDRLTGNNRDNTIVGRGGNDTLAGGAGADTFVFDRSIGVTNIDRITDFAPGEDQILLRSSIFDTIGADQPLAASMFHIGAVANEASDRILFDPTRGTLWFDRDGTGSAERVLFAIISNGADITAQDIVVL